jgi:hypothetical protein
MTEGDNKADAQTSEGAGQSGNETVVETVARKVGSTIGTIASKVSGSETSDPKAGGTRGKAGHASAQSKPSTNKHSARRLEIKKKKKTAHRRRLKASHAKG